MPGNKGIGSRVAGNQTGLSKHANTTYDRRTRNWRGSDKNLSRHQNWNLLTFKRNNFLYRDIQFQLKCLLQVNTDLHCYGHVIDNNPASACSCGDAGLECHERSLVALGMLAPPPLQHGGYYSPSGWCDAPSQCLYIQSQIIRIYSHGRVTEGTKATGFVINLL